MSAEEVAELLLADLLVHPDNEVRVLTQRIVDLLVKRQDEKAEVESKMKCR